MSENKKVKFTYISREIQSAYIFEDGDFIIFSSGESQKAGVNKNISSLFDGKTLQSKLILEIQSESCFFDLKNYEFGICKNYNQFKINKFNEERTEYKEIQIINLQQFETGRYLEKFLNGDIILSKFYMGSLSFSVYRKNDNDGIYKYQSQFHIENCEELVDLNKDEFLGYKKSIIIPESLLLMVFDKNYKIKRNNKVMAEIKDSNNNIKKKLYFTSKIIKYNDDKLIACGCSHIYIIDLKLLELETTIKLDKTIIQILVRPKGNILALGYLQIHYSKIKDRETSPDVWKYYMYNIKIDFKTNDLIKCEENDISDQVGSYSSFYKFYNYINNGLVVNTDNELIIYDDYGD